MKKNKLSIILSITLVLSLFLVTGFTPKRLTTHTVYHVYLKGESLGIIKSKQSLEEYINKKQSEVKKKYNVDKDILYWVINIKGNIDESVELDKDGNKTERDDKTGHVKKITVSKKTQDKMADEYNKKQELKLKEESIEDIRKDSVEKGLLTETGEWDESDEDLLAWKEALRDAAEEIARNIDGEVKIVKGFEGKYRYQILNQFKDSKILKILKFWFSFVRYYSRYIHH